MRRHPNSLVCRRLPTAAALWFVCFVCTGVAIAQRAGPAVGSSVSMSLTPVYEGNADLDAGGRFSVTRLLLGAGWEGPIGIGNGARLGVDLRYSAEEFDFSGDASVAGGPPWENLHFANLSTPVSWTTHETLSWRVAPLVGYAGEDGADWDDALVYGAAVSVGRMIRPGLVLGIGGGVFREIDETKGYPFLMVIWRFADRWTLSNPFRPGPAGPAGLELAREFDGNWSAGVGGTYANVRFRLDDDGPAPGGVGEVQGVPVYGRLSKAWNERISTSLWAGIVLGGELEAEDEDGRRVYGSDYDPAPFTAATLSIRY